MLLACIVDIYEAQDTLLQTSQKQVWLCAFGPIILYNGEPTYYQESPGIIRAHKGLRILLRSQMNVGAWILYLRDYFDQQLSDLIELGLPLDFDRSCSLGCSDDNRTLAIQYPTHVENISQKNWTIRLC